MKELIAKSAFWIVWSRGGIQVLSFLSAILVARLLRPEDYGIVAMAGVWTFTVSFVSEMGLGAAIVQFPDLEDRELNTCFWFSMGVAVLGYLGLYAGAPAIAAWFAAPMVSDVVRVGGLVVPLTAVRIVPDGLLRKRLALDKVSQAEMASKIASIPVVVGLAWIGAGAWALVIGVLVLHLIEAVTLFWFTRWCPGFRIGSSRLRSLIHFSAALFGNRLCVRLYQQADALILGKISGKVVLGYFSMAKSLALIPVEKISGMVNQLASPVMANLQTDRSDMRAVFFRTLRLVSCITFPVCVGMALVAQDLIRVALTDKWAPAVPLFQVLCGYALIRSLDVFMPRVLMARYRTTFLLRYGMGLCIVMPVAFYAGVVSQGAMGVAIAWLLVYPVVVISLARETLRELETKWTTLLEQLRVAAGSTVVMAGVVLTLQWMMPDSTLWERTVRLFVTSGIGATVYGVGVFWRGGLVVAELKEVLQWVLRPRRLAPAPSAGVAPQAITKGPSVGIGR